MDINKLKSKNHFPVAMLSFEFSSAINSLPLKPK